MANNVRYLSYEGLEYFWKNKLKPLIETNEEIVATALTNLDDRLNTHTHSYVASAGYVATAANAVTAGRAFYSSSAGYSASAARATSAASAGYSASAARATYAASAGYAGTADVANKVVNSLTIQANGTTLTNGVYDGSASKTVNITAESLGLTKVFDYKGITTSPLSDGSTIKPIVISSSTYTQKIGDVVIVNNDSDKEYFWNGNFWEELGRTIDLSGYLPLSGGTMTGIITSQSIIPAKNHTTSITGYNLGSSSTQFNTTYTRFVDTVSGYNLRLKAGGVEHINMLNGNVNTTANIIPTANETYDLGSTTNKYKNIYGNLSGLIKSITGSSEEPYTLNVNNALRFDSQIPSKPIGGTTWGSGYNNAILSIGRISNDNYVSQLGFTGSGLWYRAFSNEVANTTKPFDKVVLENGNKWNIVANTANGLTNVTSQIQNAKARDLTLFPKSMTLFTSGWNTSTGNFSTTWGTTLDISYSTYYQRLAFSTTGRIEYFRGINSNNSDNTSASLTKVGDLAYLSDIPTAAADIGAATESHKHAATDITSGTLSVSRGGTGLSTLGEGHIILGTGSTTATSIKFVSISTAQINAIFGL